MRRFTRLFMVTVIALASLAVSACGKKVEYAVDPPWETGEVSVLEVRRDGEKLATWEMRVEPDEAGIALVSEMIGEGFSETARVKVDPVTLFPEAVSFTQETDLNKASYSATFTTDEAIITVEPPEGSPSVPAVKVPIPEGVHYENESFLMVVRAMSLQKGFEFTVLDVATRSGKVAPVTVKVLRTEKVSSVLGETEAYVVELVGYQQYIWIAKDSPRQILKFENKAAGTVSELVSYEPRAPILP